MHMSLDGPVEKTTSAGAVDVFRELSVAFETAVGQQGKTRESVMK